MIGEIDMIRMPEKIKYIGITEEIGMIIEGIEIGIRIEEIIKGKILYTKISRNTNIPITTLGFRSRRILRDGSETKRKFRGNFI